MQLRTRITWNWLVCYQGLLKVILPLLDPFCRSFDTRASHVHRHATPNRLVIVINFANRRNSGNGQAIAQPGGKQVVKTKGVLAD